MKKPIEFLNLNRYKLNEDKLQLLVRAYLLLTLVRLGLFFLPFQTLKNLLKKFSKIQKPNKSRVTAKNIARAISRSSRLSPGKVKCLAKALTTNTLMIVYRLPCTLKIGVAIDENKALEAHAWVEADGKVVVGYLPDLARYRPMASSQEGLLL